MVMSDTFPKSSTACREMESHQLREDVHFHVNIGISSWPVSDEKLNQIRQETPEDVSLKTVLNYIVRGWLIYKKDISLEAQELFDVKNDLITVDGLLLRRNRIVITSTMRIEILERIHNGHLGIRKCQEWANQAV